MPEGIRVICQGEYVAASLMDYLHRHPEMDERCSKGGQCRFYTTESVEKFVNSANLFLNESVDVHHTALG
jgi:glutamate racemase